ncbi:hypothetical protein DAETH_04700 [Deinococcus aetherius]|uniref:HD-GYP domain-containing protein n=1 Tax=Deinococcus aetherius TaxID=200252 RepID=A0ABN6RB00_9DEIO|nr:HD-GYP domain-containing protein [Deinococcus aetherius]BDP40501.1 hypothetical protein DAETH_04700 [Deinococcus aetherius]
MSAPAPRTSSRRAGGARLSLGALLAATALHFSWLATRWGGAAGREVLADLLPMPVFVLAALYAWGVAARHRGGERRGWWGLGAALLAFAAGNGLWAYLELVAHVQPFPSVADAAFLLVTPLLAAAFVRLWPCRASGTAAVQLGLDVLTFTLAAGVWLWNFLIAPAALANGAQPLAFALSVLYPLYDLLLLSLVLVAALRRAASPALLLFALGLLCFASGDVAFAYLGLVGQYRSGHPVDASWVAGSVLFALAARASLRPGSFPAATVARTAARLPDLAFMLPHAAVILTSLLLVLTHHRQDPGARGVLLGAVLVTGLVTLRQTLAWREARALQGELRALNLDLEARVRERTLDVRRTFEGGLLALGTALEARDFETAGHTERVVKLARGLGQVLGLPPGELEALTEGAYLHDLGKLAVPDHILLKPGRLTPEEWTVMQSHATRGHALALRLPHLSPGALDVIHHHHERWDGSGYPHGLAGQAIPLAARVFAVCDVYDALTSERPYKGAWTPARARDEIGAQSGRHFDPRVAAAFLALDLEAVLATAPAAPVLQQAEQAFGARVSEHTPVPQGALAETGALLALADERTYARKGGREPCPVAAERGAAEHPGGRQTSSR